MSDRCARRQTWLTQYASARQSILASHAPTAQHLLASPETQLQTVRDLVLNRPRVLWWVDGADVASMRGIVEIAQRTGGTVHVGQSTGATLVKRTMINEGWLGTTLGEVGPHADLVITLGECILSEAPLLPSRFLSRGSDEPPIEWWHISAAESDRSGPLATVPAPGLTPSPVLSPTQVVVWPRSQWLQRLTALQLELQTHTKTGASASTNQTMSPLAVALGRSQYAVWIWDNSEFTSSIDELIISRLLGIARQQTQTARCALLNLESQVGQLTAEETLLWLTGCSGTATWNGSSWTTPRRYAAYSVDDWQREFEAIALVRTVPSVAPLPQLRAELIVATANELNRGTRSTHSSAASEVVVIPTGHGAMGYVQRGDRGSTLLVGAASSAADSDEAPANWLAGGELFAEVAYSLPTHSLPTQAPPSASVSGQAVSGQSVSGQAVSTAQAARPGAE